MEVGKLNYRILFEDRVNVVDQYGNIKHPTDYNDIDRELVWQVINVWQLGNVWNLTSTEAEAALWAAFEPRFGREMFETGRIESTVKGVITIRQHPSAQLVILPSFKIRFLSGPYRDKQFNIISITPLSDRHFVEISVEEQVQ